MASPIPLPFSKPLDGISGNTLAIHHDKLYAGYVAKKDEIATKLDALMRGDLSSANATYSELRGLKDSETFATNGVYLHETYFDVLGGDGVPTGQLADALATTYGSVDAFIAVMSACAMASRGWTVLAWDTHDATFRIVNGDAHNHGGVWGCLPLIVLDVYEHAYFIDHGSDRKAYVAAFWKNLDWSKVDTRYQKAVGRES
ncbi:superoxide dismutase [Patescibacteria group bacterium]|nr:superoxide dismutase [Patescibacteria group bacterium]